MITIATALRSAAYGKRAFAFSCIERNGVDMTRSIETVCVQGGYRPGDAEPRQVPIYQNTTWKYGTSEHMGKLFDLEESGYFYTRLQNPTNDAVAAKIA